MCVYFHTWPPKTGLSDQLFAPPPQKKTLTFSQLNKQFHSYMYILPIYHLYALGTSSFSHIADNDTLQPLYYHTHICSLDISMLAKSFKSCDWWVGEEGGYELHRIFFLCDGISL